MRGRIISPSQLVGGLVVMLTVTPVVAAEERIAAIGGAIDPQCIEGHTRHLGSDELAGRAPGTAGGNRAADYIAARLADLGLEPIGDGGGFFQQVPLHGSVPLPSSVLQIESLGAVITLELGRDYLLATTGSQTLVPDFVPMVFVGHGIIAPEFDHNDYADVDVAGKVAVYLQGEPRSDDPEFFSGSRPTVYASPETKKRIALSRGAIGSVLIPLVDEDVAARWRRTRRDFAFEDLSLAYAVPSHLSLMLHPRLAELVFAEALHDWPSVLEMVEAGSLRSFHLPVALRFEGAFRTRDVLSPNVVARLPGGDLADTAVVVSAHYDHLGIGPEIEGDAVYNGVVDNALGVAGVLEVARVLSEMRRPPRRSVIFLLTTAEEEGLLGARYFLDHPPVPVVAMAANVNVDGLAFSAPFDDVIGVGAELSTLGPTLERVVRALDLELSEAPAEFWSSESFARSDQLAFAERGVPSILINEGFSWRGRSRGEAVQATIRWLASIYHSPADDLHQPLDWQAAAQHGGVIAAFVRTLADDPSEPEWRPGVPYAYQRLLSRALSR